MTSSEIQSQLLAAVGHALGVPVHSSAARRQGGLAPWQCRKVEHYISTNLAEPLHVADLADETRLSVSHFSRACRVSFGLSPARLVRRHRLDEAVRLMRTTDLSLTAIAHSCGFADQSHFSRQFRQLTSTRPGEWRRAATRH